MKSGLDFEKPILELEEKILELRRLSQTGDMNIADEVLRLQKKLDKLLQQTYSHLSPWQKVQVARHPERPHFKDYLDRLIEDFTLLAGDRNFSEDPALIAGIGYFRGHAILIMGQEKGRDTADRIHHNFGMVRPEGYRKAARLMELAEQFQLPIITLIDTPGAHPGVDAEERGQSEAIARCLETSAALQVPIVTVITGEACSGGAIAIALANKVFMLEHAVYSVITPEGCASILWRTVDKKSEAAEAQRLTASDLLKFGIIDGIIPEPIGGAHRSPDTTIQAVGDTIEKALNEFTKIDGAMACQQRQEKFLAIGRSL